MKFELDRSELLNAVTIAAKATAQKGVRPILANILIEAESDKIRLVATDMEAMSIIEIPADVSTCGKITAPAKLLQELLSNLPGDSLFPVEVSADPQKDEIDFSMGKSKFSIRGLHAEDFPPVPVLSENMTKIKSAEFAKALKRAATAASFEDANPVQRAVLIDFTDMPVAVATDSKRLAIAEMTLTVPEEVKKQFIVPIKAANDVSAMITGSDSFEFGTFREQLVFKKDNITLVSRIVDGRFPDYKRVLPKDSPNTAKFMRKELTQAIRSVTPIARDKSNLVHFDFSHDSVKIWANNDLQNKAETEIDCKFDGVPLNIAFNAGFISKFLDVVGTDEILLKMSSPSYPGVFESVGDDEKATYILMPMTY